jgi:hypothetical protein
LQRFRLAASLHNRKMSASVMKNQVFRLISCWLILVAASAAQDFREVPTKIVNKKFIALAALSAGSTFADSYTTTWAIQNWKNTPPGQSRACNAESESPWLYGTHPTIGRVYAVAAGKSIGTTVVAYYLKKHHSRLWSLPLTINAGLSIQGMSHNLATCN